MADTVDSLRVIVRDAIGSKKDLDIPETAPLQDVVTSSLQFVVILGEIERVFEITVPDAYLDPARLRDLASMAQLVEHLRGMAA